MRKRRDPRFDEIPLEPKIVIRYANIYKKIACKKGTTVAVEWLRCVEFKWSVIGSLRERLIWLALRFDCLGVIQLQNRLILIHNEAH